MYPIKQSTAITVPFFAHDANGDAVTGLTDGSFTKRISKNGAAFGAMTVTISEMENGWYSIPLSTSHSDTLGLLTVVFTNASAKQVNLQWRVEARILDDLAYPTTSGRSIDVTTTGEVGIDLDNVNGTLDAGDIGTGAITAAKFGAGAIDAAALATDAVNEIVDQVWDEAVADHVGAGSTGERVERLDIVASGGAGGLTNARAVNLDNLDAAVSAVETDTQDIQNRLPAALVSGRMDSSVGAMAANVLTATAINADAITAAKIADGAIDAATFAADTGLQTIRSNTAAGGAAGSVTLDASASSTTDFYAGCNIFLTGGTGVGQFRTCTAYNGTTKVATVVPNWATNPISGTTFAVMPAGSVNVAAWRRAQPNALVSSRVDASVGAIAANAITATSIASNAITAAKIATDAITADKIAADAIGASEIAADAIGSSELATTAVNEIRDAILADSTAFNGASIAAILADTDSLDTTKIPDTLSLANINAEVDNALDTAIPGVPTANSINERVAAIDDKLPSGTISDFDEASNNVTVGTNNDKTGYSISGTKTTLDALNDLSAANVNSEVSDVLKTDTVTLPGQTAPPLAPTMEQILGWLYKTFRNRKTQTATQWSLLADDETTVDAKATVSDDGTTAIKQEIVSGP